MLRRAAVLVSCACCILVNASCSNLTSLLASVDVSPKTSISFPGQEEFTNATERWTTFSAPSYFGAITPGSEEDLIKVLQLVTSAKIPFLATSTRHGFNPTLGKLQHGVAIDLSRFDKLDINASAGTVTIGPAIRTADLLEPLLHAGFEIQAGTCTCPSFIGVTLGAGIGRWQGIYGLFIDALQSVRFISANGTALTASKTQNSELFWGIRGAGANLGIIIEATYGLHKITSGTNGGGMGLNADFVFSAEKNASYFAALEALGKYPAQLAVITVVMWNDTIKETQILSNWMYFGPEDEARKLMAPFIDLGPSISSIEVVPYDKLLYYQGFGIDASLCEDNLVRELYTASIRTIVASTWQGAFTKMAQFYHDFPDGRALSVLELETYPNQATTAVADDETAYPWRDATGYLAFQFGWPQGTNSTVIEASAALGRQLRTDFAATSGYQNEPGLHGGLAVYVNYAHGDEPLESIYRADKLPRLAALKKKWDPSNVFAYHLALPTQYP